MCVTIAWHEIHDSLSCLAGLAAELGYLIRVWEGSNCYGSYTVICARQLFGDNTVLPHYESHTVNLTKSYSLGLGPGEGGCKGP